MGSLSSMRDTVHEAIWGPRRQPCCFIESMDDEIAEIQRRIDEARGIQRRLTRMQARIRQQHDRLNDAIREVSEGHGSADQLPDPATKGREARSGYSGR